MMPNHPATTVDQNPIRRRGVGLRALDPALACPGYTLFAPQAGTGQVYLIDLEGKLVHQWQMPYPPGIYGYLTERGTLLYNGKIPGDDFIGKAPFRGGAMLEATWSGKVLWEVRHPSHHHDGRLLSNGNLVLLGAAELPPSVAARVTGGRAGTEEHGAIWADTVVEMTQDGHIVWEWRAWEHLDPADYPITAAQDERAEWTHGNSVYELPGGDLLVSFRNISTVVRIDRRTGEVVWRLGAPPLSGQHAPYLLDNGHYLLFDNGPHRLDHTYPFSRVLEIDPATHEIVWNYQEALPFNFYSPRISNAQRLPNGNTLVNEGVFGRFFEVTPAGETVWEYVNPYLGPEGQDARLQTNRVFRVYRYSAAEIARARATG